MSLVLMMLSLVVLLMVMRWVWLLRDGRWSYSGPCIPLPRQNIFGSPFLEFPMTKSKMCRTSLEDPPSPRKLRGLVSIGPAIFSMTSRILLHTPAYVVNLPPSRPVKRSGVLRLFELSGHGLQNFSPFFCLRDMTKDRRPISSLNAQKKSYVFPVLR
jgi:hypothetical protein